MRAILFKNFASLALILAAFVVPQQARAQAQPSPAVQDQIAAINAEMAQAIDRVAAIVNQPVQHFPRRPYIPVYIGGWFHPGALTPDFNNVDIRQTQQFPYAKSNYVSSDLNPTEMFYGPELEFNSMTKYFVTDRTVPKKRLSEAEMLEINRLYRVIGRDESELTQLRGDTAPAAASKRNSPLIVWIGAAVLAGLAILFLRKKPLAS